MGGLNEGCLSIGGHIKGIIHQKFCVDFGEHKGSIISHCSDFFNIVARKILRIWLSARVKISLRENNCSWTMATASLSFPVELVYIFFFFLGGFSIFQTIRYL